MDTRLLLSSLDKSLNDIVTALEETAAILRTILERLDRLENRINKLEMRQHVADVVRRERQSLEEMQKRT